MKETGAFNFESPLSVGADQIRDVIKNAVGSHLNSIFPRNRQYKAGDLNRIFIVVEGEGDQFNGFHQKANILMLGPEGNLDSGWTNQRVLSDYSYWEFDKVAINPASNLEVVSYGHLILQKLYAQVAEEIFEQTDGMVVDRMQRFLNTETDTSLAIITASQRALQETYGLEATIAIEACQPAVEEALQVGYSLIQGQ